MAATYACRRPGGHLLRQSLYAGQQRGGRARHTAWYAGDEVDVDLAPKGQSMGVDQTPQRRHVPKVEQLELGDDLALLGQTIKLGHERVRIQEDVLAEVGRAARQTACLLYTSDAADE